MHMNPASFPPSLIAKIVRCVEDAVGDDIQADIQRNDLQTQNSVPSRIWDLLNTNVIRGLDTFSPSCVRSGLRNCENASINVNECITLTY